MRRGGRDYRGHRGGEPYGGHGVPDNINEKLEPVNRENEEFYDTMDNPQDPWDPEPCDWDRGNDEDDEL